MPVRKGMDVRTLKVVGEGAAKKVVARICVRVGQDGSVHASLEGGLRGIHVTNALMALGEAVAHPAEAMPLTRMAGDGVAS
jgi:hypothetical protein